MKLSLGVLAALAGVNGKRDFSKIQENLIFTRLNFEKFPNFQKIWL